MFLLEESFSYKGLPLLINPSFSSGMVHRLSSSFTSAHLSVFLSFFLSFFLSVRLPFFLVFLSVFLSFCYFFCSFFLFCSFSFRSLPLSLSLSLSPLFFSHIIRGAADESPRVTEARVARQGQVSWDMHGCQNVRCLKMCSTVKTCWCGICNSGYPRM